jgi:hypothetical protein
MLLRSLYTISKLCASISNFVFFDIGVSLSDLAWAAVAPTRYWTQIVVCTLHCKSIIARGASAAAGAALGGAFAPVAPGAAPAGAARGPAEYVCWSKRRSYVKLNLVPESPWPSLRLARFPSLRIVDHNFGLNYGSSQSSHSRCVLVMPDTRNHQHWYRICWFDINGFKSISDYQYWYRSNNVESKVTTLGPTRLLWYPRAYCGVHALITIYWRITYDIEYHLISNYESSISKKIIDIELVESISRGLNRYRIINIELHWLISISVNTIPHCFRGKIPREAAADSRPDSGTGSRLFEINMWMWRYGRNFPRQISADQAVKLRKKKGTWRWDSSAQAWCSLPGWAKPCQVEGSFRSAVNDIGWILYRIQYRIRYIRTWPSILNVRKTFDIVYDINMRYRTMFIRYRRHETSISTTLFMTFDIEGLWPSISDY